MASGLLLDLAGRLRNFRLPHSRGLIPVFEAIVNSLHAIEESKGSNGRIIIEVKRMAQSASGMQRDLPLGEQTTRAPILGFRVIDNGIGFTAENFTSFLTSDSRRKLALGGRGIGRFTWLKVFRRVSIDSVYRVSAGRRRRSFQFSAESGVEDVVDEECEDRVPIETKVVLDGLDEAFGALLPKRTSTLGQHVVDHCFGAIRAAGKPIRVELVDGEADPVNISGLVDQMFANALVDNLTIEGQAFKLTHLQVSSAETQAHKLVFMGAGREVRVERLAQSIPQLGPKLDNGAGSFWWWSLVESVALDDAVTPERDNFVLPDDNDLLPGVLSIPGIRQAVIPVIAKRLEPFIEPIKERTREQVRRFVETEAPEYRHVVTMRPEAIDRLPPDLPREKLDAELHRVNYEIESGIRAKGEKILRGEQFDASAYETFLTEENAIGKANLARYVVHRRRVLDLFRKALTRAEDGKYSLEQAVHDLIFPLQQTSDDVPYEQLNLWMIDERLAYHYYLASDKKLSALKPLETTEAKRPDIIVFNAPFAFSDHDGPFNSIVLVEFKRPLRDDYTADDNPILQVYDYIRRVRAGSATDRAGRPITVLEHVPFYCYVVCDVTRKLIEAAENAALTRTPDGEGFFGFNLKLCAYVEVISFTKVVADAEKRNRVLFDKLNLPK